MLPVKYDAKAIIRELNKVEFTASTVHELTETIVDLRVDVDGNSASVVQEALTRVSEDEALAQLTTDLTATVSSNDSTQSAAVSSEQTARATADTALASDITSLTATVTSGDSTNAAAITSEQTARATADTALASDITSLTATVTSGDSTNAAAITAEATARADADSAIASTASTLAATVTSGDSTNAAAISTEQTARANADSALSSDITTLTSSINGVSASVTTEASTRASADSAIEGDVSALEAHYGVTLDVNDYITGFSQNNDGTTGTFKILADVFKIIDPAAGSGQAGLDVFTYSGGVVSLGTGIKLTADDIEAGTMSADRIQFDGQYLEVVGGFLKVTGSPGAYAISVVDDTTGNTDASVTVTRVSNGNVRIGVDWSLSKAWPSDTNEPGDPFPVTLTLQRDSTTIKTWTVSGIFTDGDNSAGEPFVAIGNFNTSWYDSDTGSGSTTYTLSATTLATANFDLETQLSARPSQ